MALLDKVIYCLAGAATGVLRGISFSQAGMIHEKIVMYLQCLLYPTLSDPTWTFAHIPKSTVFFTSAD